MSIHVGRDREQLTLGASHIKLMAGGGVASNYDPLGVTQYTVPELGAAARRPGRSNVLLVAHNQVGATNPGELGV